MIDKKRLLSDFEGVQENLAKRFLDPTILETLKEQLIAYKAKKQELEQAQEFQNKSSKLFFTYKDDPAKAQELKNALEANKVKIADLVAHTNTLEEELDALLHTIPNLLDPITPFGKDENDNVEIKRVLEPKTFSFTPKEHHELAQENGWIEFERGVKIAQSRFSVLRKEGALLSRALLNFMLDYNYKAGFEIVSPPILVNTQTLFGTGQLPKFKEDLFKVQEEDLYLIPTSEVSLTNLYADEILTAEELPILMTACTPCFRKEAGSAGKDTRGIIRQHQFDKVELVAITHPKESDAMQAKMLETASGILKALELPHRFMQLCSGDIGFSASNTIDIEVWLPGQNCYREISSVSNTRDFQARRAKIRYKENKKNTFVHTLNGSSLAVGRTLVALMENHQEQDGHIKIPKVLLPYLPSTF
ncbi:Seryl-tRNA synthetase SerS [Helicobacter sp. NHP19-012]|uniref:Serine--tRNA ligase n=1 Tax=Helicobacter gastrofelis TaxID=2849642 RepID=A0ABM7SES6_9HELI|nr:MULTISPECIES: serine--tRNA ligase [unclassified Helicobacter]BCZ18511.1 Seryl-tRNA synthetase SerS [Helicobacter sp. NHP19-012]GMB95785.1 Seryl-tRNA synthetase SerS [Helicobacter sp. NHP22-001]